MPFGKNVTRSKSHVNFGLDIEDYYKIKDQKGELLFDQN